jgi:hypothetical protein
MTIRSGVPFAPVFANGVAQGVHFFLAVHPDSDAPPKFADGMILILLIGISLALNAPLVNLVGVLLSRSHAQP